MTWTGRSSPTSAAASRNSCARLQRLDEQVAALASARERDDARRTQADVLRRIASALKRTQRV